MKVCKKSVRVGHKVKIPATGTTSQIPQVSAVEINPDFARALDFLENTNKNIFITGKAGTGKSTLLQYFREHTAKNVAVLAPTGVAALNVKGQTIHSFFHFPPHITVQTVAMQSPSKKLKDLLQKIDAIIIDEVSMVRADLMDCIDVVLQFYRNNPEPFGGLQMIFIGDLYQLPPVVSGKEEQELFRTYYESPYFFSAKVFGKIEMEFLELNKIYRQKDQDFIDLLNKIRNGSVDDHDISNLNTRCNPDFDHDDSKNIFYVTLTTTNASADILNYKKLSDLNVELKTYDGKITGMFDDKHLPTLMKLSLKIGSQIMLLNNDPGKRWVNGSIGKIIDIECDEESDEDTIVVKLNDGKTVYVTPCTWEIFRYFFNKKRGHLDVEIIGSFTQYPIRLAWAITIHKSQGKTFDNVVIDLGRGSFVQGQVYVAISRCTSFSGMVLKKPIQKKHIWIDYRIMRFLTRYQYAISEKELPLEIKIKRIKDAIEKDETIEMIYLKTNDVKSHRTIQPKYIGDLEYLGKTFFGIEAFCLKRQEMRHFRVDRILKIQ
ncbi:AAA family ATPase [Candidatus Peregrinibacteria bacterium]|nr:AAA family ATPase [Candidatus Peregrinibacteria bacterium]